MSRIVAALGLAMLFAATACATQPAPMAASGAAAPAEDVYRLGLGDKVRINVFGEPSLSGEFQVSGSGAVTMPLVGDVPAVGKTARELEAALIERFGAGYIKDPKIAVEVYSFRPYFVLGEVQKPGRYPALEGTSLLGAIATAGGFTYRANTKRVFLRRVGDSKERAVSIDDPLQIMPGDVLRIGERYF
jgi:polysaccharide export outer membrane protein